MLRAENRGELAIGRGGEPVDNMAKVVVDRGGVGEHADAQAVQARRGEQSFGAEQHGSGAVARRGRAHETSCGIGPPRLSSICVGRRCRRV